MLEAKQSRQSGGAKEVVGQPTCLSRAEPRVRGVRRDGQPRLGRADAERAPAGRELCPRLPASHGWPPFILVCDVGHCLELYADFSGQGKNYAQFPDRQGFRIYLEDLRSRRPASG